MANFASLKKQSGNLDKLAKAIESISENAPSKEDNFWKPDVDKSGNGYAVIRFLPSPAVDAETDGDNSLPWAKIWDHGFQGPGGWYIENSLTTLGEKDPVSEYNTKLWNSGIEANKEIARKQKRRLSYVSNIYVVEDPKHPENEGKVFLFKYGKKIFEKIKEAMNPQFADEKPLNPFDMWSGANFKLKIRNVEGYRNYDRSEFDKTSVLGDFDDGDLEKIWKQEHSLKQFLARENFKTYEELETKLNRVLGLTGETKPRTTVEQARATKDTPKASRETVTADVSEDEDDDLSYFSKLASDD